MTAFPKPGDKKKSRSKTKSLYIHNIEEPKNRECRNCDVENGDECFHHPEATRIKFVDGGGIMGGKNNDRTTAWLCVGCGVEFDTKPDKNAPQQEHDQHALFSYDCIIKTWNIEREV